MPDTTECADATLSDLLQTGGQMIVRYKGIRIPVRYKKGTGDSIIFLFHGAADRSVREIPFFQSFLPNASGAHQFSISDPTMLITETVKTGWYSGAQGIDLQQILRDLFREIRETLHGKRQLYVGASSGGFAALLYSFFDPDGIAISAIPQTILQNHYPRPIQQYLKECWPDCKTISDVASKASFDLPALYAKGFENLVIYVQNTGDRFHMTNHFSPFLAAIGDSGMERLICDVGFWGKFGHGGTTPPSAYLPWVEAALLVSSPTADKILGARFALSEEQVEERIATEARKADNDRKPPGPSTRHLKLNGMVRDYLLTDS